MLSLKPQLINRGLNDFVLGWTPLPRTHALSYNLYRSSSESGPYTLFRSDIGNNPTKASLGRGKIIASIMNNEIPIIGIMNVYFKLTLVDANGVESDLADSIPTKVDVDGVSTLYEGEDSNRNAHGYGWDETNRRWMKLMSSPTGLLKVDIGSGTINANISNIKVAARADNLTEEYLLVTNDRKLVVSMTDAIDANVDHSVAIYEPTSNVVDSAENVLISPLVVSSILSHTALIDFKLMNATATGTADGIYRLMLNGVMISKKRTSWTSRNADFNFERQGINIAVGDVIDITVEHEESQDKTFDASIVGVAAVII